MRPVVRHERRVETEDLPDCVVIDDLPFVSLDRFQLVEYVRHELAEGRGGWMITANVDHLQRHASSRAIRELYRDADLITADGVPLLWAARLQGTPLPDRVAGADLVPLLAEQAAKEGHSLYLMGGRPGVAAAAGRAFRRQWPGLRIAGTSSPWTTDDPSEEEMEPIRKALELADPDIVFVALGSPKQERVIAALRASFPRTWWLGAGIGLSFVCRDVTRAPAWVQRSGLEWVHRLAQEPTRLFRRYLVDDAWFALRMLGRSAAKHPRLAHGALRSRARPER